MFNQKLKSKYNREFIMVVVQYELGFVSEKLIRAVVDLNAREGCQISKSKFNFRLVEEG